MSSEHYYLPEPSQWPIIGSVALFLTLLGAIHCLHGGTAGPYILGVGFLLLFYMLFGWIGTVIQEDQKGLLLSKQTDRSFRWGMFWFIFSEVMFFGAFFGALFYARILSVPWLGGEGAGMLTHLMLWPDFHAHWPLIHTPDPSQFEGPTSAMHAWGLPAVNTVLLLTSGLTLTVAHVSLLHNRYWPGIVAQTLTILLGLSFLGLQVLEYTEAYLKKGLSLGSGIYGTTFFLLTGFHGLHVCLGIIMLTVVLCRMIKRHFNQTHHFGFEAVAWYWHFVDVVWLLLFIFVYWL